MITSRVTSKAQTTIPQPVRAALGIGQGDELGYVIEDGRVLLMKAPARPVAPETDDPFAMFTEWESESDRKAFAGL